MLHSTSKVENIIHSIILSLDERIPFISTHPFLHLQRRLPSAAVVLIGHGKPTDHRMLQYPEESQIAHQMKSTHELADSRGCIVKSHFR